MRRKRGGRRIQTMQLTSQHRWVVSYADLMTLLLAFFVVMYAMSSVNQGKYRVLTESLKSAFESMPTAVMPIDLGGGAPSDQVLQALLDAMEAPMPVPVTAPTQGVATGIEPTDSEPEEEATDREGKLNALRERVAQAGGNVEETPRGIEVQLDADLLFASGRAELAPEVAGKLAGIAAELEVFPGRIEVEGHTDDRPIESALFPSNWELSAARAASVVKAMLAAELSPLRFSAIGFGQYRPVADNVTAEGRGRNRRVVVRLREAEEDALPEVIASGANAGLGGLQRLERWPAPEGLRL
jgi:chemotaxis protein MotB